MTVKSSSTEAICCVFTRKLCRRISSDSWKNSCKKRQLRLKQKINLSLKKLCRLSPTEILNCLKKASGSPNSLSPQSFPQLIPSLFETWRSLAFLLTTSLIWHAAAPSIKVTPDSEVVFLKGTEFFLQKDGGKGCWSFDGVPTDARKSLCNWGYKL